MLRQKPNHIFEALSISRNHRISGRQIHNHYNPSSLNILSKQCFEPRQAIYSYFPPGIDLHYALLPRSDVLAQLSDMSARSNGTRRSVTYIKSQGLRAICLLISKYANQTLTALEQTGLQRNNNELHTRACMLTNIILDLLHVGIIKRSINLVENKEGTRLIGMYCEEEG